jgi:hypothetical protein
LAPSPSYPAPTVPVQPAPGVPATSQPTFEPAPQPESRMMQPLQLNPSTSLGVPRALDPESQDRMTKSPVRQAFAARLVSTDSSITRYEDDGWRAAE